MRSLCHSSREGPESNEQTSNDVLLGVKLQTLRGCFSLPCVSISTETIGDLVDLAVVYGSTFTINERSFVVFNLPSPSNKTSLPVQCETPNL